MRVSTAFSFQRATQDVQSKLAEIGTLQTQIGSGKKLLRPSDAPTEAARAVDLNQAISQLDQFGRNRTFANQQLGLVDATLTSVNNLLLRVRDLTIQANNGSQTDETRNIIKTEIQQRLSELLDYANARDGNGDFLFAGNKGTTQPFTQTGSGIVYNGDQSPQQLKISSNRFVDISESGFEVFQRVRSGNGSFETDIDPTNTGSGIITGGTVVDFTTYQPDDFEIVFTSAATFDVVNTTTAATVLSAQPYTDGQSINFNGIDVSITGEPQTGDRFTIDASRNQDIFETLNNLISTLSISPNDSAGEARLQQGLENSIADIDQALGNVLSVRTSVGTRQNSIDSADLESEGAKIQLQQTLSEVQDLDLADAVSRLQFQLTTLEAVQATFANIQRLSLFDFLR